MYFSVSSHRGRINEPGVEDAGEREGNIERVRHMALLDFEIMMLDLNRWFVSWRCALRYPLRAACFGGWFLIYCIFEDIDFLDLSVKDLWLDSNFSKG